MYCAGPPASMVRPTVSSRTQRLEQTPGRVVGRDGLEAVGARTGHGYQGEQLCLCREHVEELVARPKADGEPDDRVGETAVGDVLLRRPTRVEVRYLGVGGRADGAGEHEALHARRGRGPQHVPGALDVDAVEGVAAALAHDRDQVHHAADAVAGEGQRLRVEDVALDRLDAVRQPAFGDVPVHQGAHRQAGGRQRGDDAASDEAGPAGYEYRLVEHGAAERGEYTRPRVVTSL